MPPRISEESLLDDIRDVYEKLGKPPSESEYKKHGTYSPSAIRGRFGKFTNGREAADIPNPDMRGANNKIPREDLIEEIHAVAKHVTGTPTREDLYEYGTHAEGPFRREFGSWSEALLEAGYSYDELNRPGTQIAKQTTVECTVCGATETRLKSDLTGKRNVFCSQDCLHTWRSKEFTGDTHPLRDRIEVECEVCGETLERRPSVIERRDHHFCSYVCTGQWRSENLTGENAPSWKGGGELYRGPNWIRQRERTLERDEYACVRCGCSEEEHFEEYDRQLSVHHVKSVREFYHEAGEHKPDYAKMNSLENLVTLCVSCHRSIESLPITPQFETSKTTDGE